jgi:succinate dehydrogenase / fumarate reductase flavoprotein subunit
MTRFDKLRNANGGTPTAVLREKMQKTMQDDAAGSAPGIAGEGCKLMSEIWGESPTSRSPTVR